MIEFKREWRPFRSFKKEDGLGGDDEGAGEGEQGTDRGTAWGRRVLLQHVSGHGTYIFLARAEGPCRCLSLRHKTTAIRDATVTVAHVAPRIGDS